MITKEYIHGLMQRKKDKIKVFITGIDLNLGHTCPRATTAPAH